MNRLDTFIELKHKSGIFEWVINHRNIVVLFSVLLTFAIGAGLMRLQFSSDYKDFFAADNPKLAAFEALQDKFVRSNNVYIAVESHNGNIFTAEGLKLLSQMTANLWKLPYVIRVDSVTNYQFLTAKRDDIIISDLMTTDEEINDLYAFQLYQKALLEKGLNRYLVGENQALTGINVSLADAVTSDDGKVEFMQALNALLAAFSGDEVKTYITGSVAIDHGFDIAAQQDVETLYSIVYLMVLVLSWFLTRSFAAVSGILLVVSFSWLISLGVAGWLGIKLTAISVSAPTVLMTLAVAQSMHIIFSIQKNRAHGMEINASVQYAMESNILPLFLVFLSTASGFLAIMTSEVPPLQDLGFILACGVFTVFLLVIIFLPAFLSYFSLQAKSYTLKSERSMGELGYFVSRHAGKLVTIGVIIALGMLVPLADNVINDNFVEYFDSNNRIRKDSEYINQHLTGIHHIYFELESNEKGGVFTQDYLSHLDDLTNWLNRQPEVRHVTSYTDIVKRLNRASYGDLDEAYRLPDNTEIASQLHLLYEMSLPLGLTTNNIVDIDQKSTRLSIVLDNLSSAEMLSLENRIIDWHEQKGISVTLHPGTGPSMMFADIGQRNSESLIMSTLLALLMVSAVLMIALRNIKLSLVSLIPNLVPPILAFGFWGLYDGEVGLAISIVAVMTFGIIVDDTIYILTRFKQNMHRATFDDALSYTYRQVGKPITNTTVILTCGFLVLVFSNFRLNQGMGMLTALVIFLALLWDLFVLPGLMKKLVYRNYQDKGVIS
jgi:predicted RND superfamily exporter protein